ncbi:MAG: Cof-type HAD-IIB family hydrolase [Oscillospiraceae bacterium]|nr:Cof-type HAD-IIB family hydrolase [Oscillospiraceae bacterium]
MDNIKLIVTDLDGTFLRSDSSISEYTKAVIARCRERGILIAFATARSEISAEPFSRQINPDIMISNSGALARCGLETLYKATIPPDNVHALILRCIYNSLVFQIGVETNDEYFRIKLPDDEGYSPVTKADFSGGDVYKLSVQSNDSSIPQAIANDFPEINLLSYRDIDWHSFRSIGASKENAMLAVADSLGISAENIAAFGDDVNDIGMLKEAGIGVAVQNAVPEVKAAADHICGHNDEDSVARWIEEIIL